MGGEGPRGLGKEEWKGCRGRKEWQGMKKEERKMRILRNFKEFERI